MDQFLKFNSMNMDLKQKTISYWLIFTLCISSLYAGAFPANNCGEKGCMAAMECGSEPIAQDTPVNKAHRKALSHSCCGQYRHSCCGLEAQFPLHPIGILAYTLPTPKTTVVNVSQETGLLASEPVSIRFSARPNFYLSQKRLIRSSPIFLQNQSLLI